MRKRQTHYIQINGFTLEVDGYYHEANNTRGEEDGKAAFEIMEIKYKETPIFSLLFELGVDTEKIEEEVIKQYN